MTEDNSIFFGINTELFKTAWMSSVCGQIVSIEDPNWTSVASIRLWMFKTLLHGAGSVLSDWKIPSAENLRDQNGQLFNASDLDNYVGAAIGHLANWAKNIDRTKGQVFDSWPRRMRQTGEFNCVGAIVLGAYYLDLTGTEYYIGHPTSHVMTVLRFENQWKIADFNGNTYVERSGILNPNKKVPVLQLSSKVLFYDTIELFEPQELPSFVLGNLREIVKLATDPKYAILGTSYEKVDATQYFEENRGIFDIDLEKLRRILYPKSCGT